MTVTQVARPITIACAATMLISAATNTAVLGLEWYGWALIALVFLLFVEPLFR